MDARAIECTEDVLHHRQAADIMQNLGLGGLHPRSLSCGEDDPGYFGHSAAIVHDLASGDEPRILALQPTSEGVSGKWQKKARSPSAVAPGLSVAHLSCA